MKLQGGRILRKQQDLDSRAGGVPPSGEIVRVSFGAFAAVKRGLWEHTGR